MERTAYIYSLSDPSNNDVRYIGKTVNPHVRMRQHLLSNSKTYNSNWIKSLLNNGITPSMEIIDEVPEAEWQFWEMHYIALYKSWGFRLGNANIGGGSNKGIYVSEETRRKLSESHFGQKGYWAGKKKDRASVEKQRAKVTGLKKSEEAKELMRQKMIGRKHTWGNKISKSLMGNTCSKGRVLTEEHKRKIKESNIRTAKIRFKIA